MIDLKQLREDRAAIEAWLASINYKGTLDALVALDSRRRELLAEGEALNARRNAGAKEVGLAKKEGRDASALMEEMRLVGERAKEIESLVAEVEADIHKEQMMLPCKPHETVPFGKDETENVEVRRWGDVPVFDFEPQAHWDLGEKLGIIDAERAVRLSGSRFTLLRGYGAQLERALTNYMLDMHQKQGYEEFNCPVLAGSPAMEGTGKLPKFAEDLYHLKEDDLWLIPTAEVPLTALYSTEILSEEQLPMYMTAYTPCFRRESGSYGRDVRGIMRLHQFDKVEMVKYATPETSYDELEKMVLDAEAVLQGLKLPYRVINLCTGDLGFAAAKTYDVEVWLPSEGQYREISSCSNCEDFQTRRSNMRYRPSDGGKVRYYHTLNGSGLAVGRTLIALLENYQQADGSVLIPEVLRPYMGGLEIITARK